jgi:Tfp pilus assembly protein PilE
MAKLIITNPTVYWFQYAITALRVPAPGIPIAVDDQQVASVLLGQTIELEVSGGHHEFRAGTREYGSQQVGIDVVSEETRRFALDVSTPVRKVAVPASILAMLSLIPQLWLLRLGPHGMPTLSRQRWSSVLFLPLAVVTMGAMALRWFIMFRARHFEFVEISGPDLTAERVAILLRSQPYRVRISMRQLMVAVAILAVLLAAAIAWTRREKSEQFRAEAARNARLEEFFQMTERSFLDFAAQLESRGENSGETRQIAAKLRAEADYYAALRRKYEHAATQGWLIVAPDPPLP